MTETLSTRPAKLEEYVAPALVQIGMLHELTLACDKQFGDSDGFTFMGQSIVCRSSA